MKKTRRRKRRWMTLDIGGAKWPVWLVDSATLHECAGETEIEGLTNPAASEILIDDSAEVSRRVVIFLHEVLHACLNPPGAGALIPHIFGVKLERAGEVEENVVSHLAPILAGALGGVLRLPAAPKREKKP